MVSPLPMNDVMDGGIPGSSHISSSRVILKNVNFNSANTDTSFLVGLPVTGGTRYSVLAVYVCNATAPLTSIVGTASCGVFSGAGGTGVTVAALQNMTITNTMLGENTVGNLQSLTLASPSGVSLTSPSLFVRVGNAGGIAATADVIVHISYLS